jgi:hypothetical protein
MGYKEKHPVRGMWMDSARRLAHNTDDLFNRWQLKYSDEAALDSPRVNSVRKIPQTTPEIKNLQDSAQPTVFELPKTVEEAKKATDAVKEKIDIVDAKISVITSTTLQQTLSPHKKFRRLETLHAERNYWSLLQVIIRNIQNFLEIQEQEQRRMSQEQNIGEVIRELMQVREARKNSLNELEERVTALINQLSTKKLLTAENLAHIDQVVARQQEVYDQNSHKSPDEITKENSSYKRAQELSKQYYDVSLKTKSTEPLEHPVEVHSLEEAHKLTERMHRRYLQLSETIRLERTHQQIYSDPSRLSKDLPLARDYYRELSIWYHKAAKYFKSKAIEEIHALYQLRLPSEIVELKTEILNLAKSITFYKLKEKQLLNILEAAE